MAAPINKTTTSNPVYDTIGSKYDFITQLPWKQIESASLLAVVSQLNIVGARVLDLACGTGYFSRKLHEWGAASVVGVDISPVMIDVAKQLAGDDYDDTMQFKVGDGQFLGKFNEEGFDIVTAAWLIPYAGTEDELVDMFSTISNNLKSDSGVFVGITRPPATAAYLDLLAARENEGDRRKEPPMRLTYQYYARNERMEGPDAGWRVSITGWDEKGEEELVKFTNYHLSNEVIERAAKRGGMRGKFEWKPVTMLEDMRAIEDYGEEFWMQYFKAPGPHFGLFVVRKGAEE